VPIDQRIATFDNDGTLWAEQPIYFQVVFALDRLKVVAAEHPEMRAKQPFGAALSKDLPFMRPWVGKAYGIPPEQVVGSSEVVQFRMRPDGTPELIKLAKVEFVDDGPGKPVGINRFIGRRPIFAFGNSDGDQQMLEWTAADRGASFMGLVHHTDAAREWAYDRKSHVGRLDKALDEATRRGWTVVDMKNDWKVIFPFEKDSVGSRALQ
jgi:hypothetical protein